MKKALCIGINYKGTPYELNGCINDADDWASLLGTNGFDVAVLAEKQATRVHMIDAMKRLIRKLMPGDVGFITYSGHGTWVPDIDGDEPDGRDEAFVPYDTTDDGQNLIIDDEMGVMLADVPTGSHLVLLTDCCHSGTIYRMMAGTGHRRVRFLPPAHFMRSQPMVAKMDRAFGQLKVKTNAPLPGVLHMSGCRDNEYSADTFINGRPVGAFSYFATRAFGEAAALGKTYAEAHKDIRKHLPSWDFQQTPLLNAQSALKKIKVFG